MADPRNTNESPWRDDIIIEPEASKEEHTTPQLPPKDPPYHHFGYVADNWSQSTR
jgi:hypothetical protein